MCLSFTFIFLYNIVMKHFLYFKHIQLGFSFTNKIITLCSKFYLIHGED